MKKDVYLENATAGNILIPNALEMSNTDPLLLTNTYKEFFEKEYTSATQIIKEAISHNTPVIHIKNVHKKSYDVLTPYSGTVQVEGVESLICQIYGIIGVINTWPVLYKDENAHIMRAVAPRKNARNERSSQSPYNDLDWHSDAAYRPIITKNHLSPMPDYLVFGVVHKGYQSLPIVYVALEDILKQLSEEDILDGLRSEFAVLSADSFETKVRSENIPLLAQDNNGVFYSRITFQNAIPLTERASSFLQKVKDIVAKADIKNIVNVEPGDIVVLSNKTTLHKRDSYTPKWDGKDRYFIRIYSVKDLSQGIQSDINKPWIWA